MPAQQVCPGSGAPITRDGKVMTTRDFWTNWTPCTTCGARVPFDQPQGGAIIEVYVPMHRPGGELIADGGAPTS